MYLHSRFVCLLKSCTMLQPFELHHSLIVVLMHLLTGTYLYFLSGLSKQKPIGEPLCDQISLIVLIITGFLTSYLIELIFFGATFYGFGSGGTSTHDSAHSVKV